MNCATLRTLAVMLIGSLGFLQAVDMTPEVLARIHAAYAFVHGGSGVVVSEDGLVLTNHHVIDGEDDLQVRLMDGRSFAADLLGTDPVGDIALLKARSATGLTPVSLASAGDLRPGIDVWALGNPFGLGDLDDRPTLTRGVLSTGRLVRGDYTDAVQTDAPVNPGNSGGPLFDHEGRLLGINGQIRTITGMRVNSGIGLAIAAPQLLAFLPVLRDAQGGFVRHAAAPAGLEVEDHEDGPVIRTGTGALIAGDRLVTIEGRSATSRAVAMGLLASAPWQAGITATIGLLRHGSPMAVELPLGRTPVPGRAWIGWQVEERTRGGKREVVITSVDSGSPVDKARILAGSVLKSVNGREIRNRVDLLRSTAGLEPSDRCLVELLDTAGEPIVVRIIARP